MTQYTIAGKVFELRPLTLRQRFLTKEFSQKLRQQIIEMAAALPYAGEPSNNPKWAESLRKSFEVTIQVEELILNEREQFNRFLATILVPPDAARWIPEMVELHKETMWDIDEVTEGQVIADFFSRATKSPVVSQVSIEASTNGKNVSATLEPPRN